MMVLDVLRGSSARYGAFAGLVALGAAAAGPAQATATFTSEASGFLTITDITTSGEVSFDDLLINGSATVVDFGSTGGATADGTAVFDVDSLEQAASATGSLNASPGGGSAQAFYFTDGSMSLENTSEAGSFTIEFAFDYGLTATAGVDDVLTEDAFAMSTVLLSSSQDDIVDETLTADTVFGEEGGRIADMISFSLTAGPGVTEELFLTVDAEGGASVQGSGPSVAGPATLPLMATALGIFWVFGGRFNKA